jgi:hypothetical protein
MFDARDVIWSSAICAALTLLLQCRPAWSARRFIERESKAGFAEAYQGHRVLGGEVIVQNGSGTRFDPLAPMVTARRLEITAERTSWTGDKAEFVVRHVIELQGFTSAGSDASQEIHVRIEKRGARWQYTLFQVRDRGPLPDPNARNPWAVTLKPG